MLRAGRLRQRVDVVVPREVDDGKGGFRTALMMVAAGVPAEVIGLRGSEAVQEKILQGIRVYQVTIRWRADFPLTGQLTYGCEQLNVRSAVDPDGRREQLVIIADTDSTLRS